MFEIYDAQTEKLLKKLFAAAWVRNPDNAWDAAREIEQDHGRQMYIINRWQDDADVLAEKTRLLAHFGPAAKVPDKQTFAAEVYQAGRDAKNNSEKLANFKFFAELMGYVETGRGGGVNVNVNQVLGAKIMAVPVAASETQWEAQARAHSEKLMAKHG